MSTTAGAGLSPDTAAAFSRARGRLLGCAAVLVSTAAGVPLFDTAAAGDDSAAAALLASLPLDELRTTLAAWVAEAAVQAAKMTLGRVKTITSYTEACVLVHHLVRTEDADARAESSASGGGRSSSNPPAVRDGRSDSLMSSWGPWADDRADEPLALAETPPLVLTVVAAKDANLGAIYAALPNLAQALGPVKRAVDTFR